MVDEVITLAPAKDASLRRDRDSASAPWGDWRMAHTEPHLIGGFSPGLWTQYASLIQFDLDWFDIAEVKKAELVVYTADDHEGVKTTKQPLGNMKVVYKKGAWTTAGGGEQGWASGTADNVGSMATDETFRGYVHVSDIALTESVGDITPLINAWAPSSVKVKGRPGYGRPNYGAILTQAGEVSDNRDWVVGSEQHPNTALRPFLRLTIVRKGGPGIVVALEPQGVFPETDSLAFEGRYEPGRPNDRMVAYDIYLKDEPSGPNLWPNGIGIEANSNEVTSGIFHVEVPSWVKKNHPYLWQARVKTAQGDYTPWTANETFTISTLAPNLDAVGPTGSRPSLHGVYFQGNYRDVNPTPASFWEVQVKAATSEWDDLDLYWDSGRIIVPTTTPVVRETDPPAILQNLRSLYQGAALPPGDFSYRMRATNTSGGQSAWDEGSFSLTAGYDPNPGAYDFMTGYARKRNQWRILIKTLGANRGPGATIADLRDAANAGASEFYNAAGEFFFTLPVTHPQASVIEPYKAHWALEEYRGEGWREQQAGLIIDFDATEDEVVFYGTDYLGLLMRLQETRYDPQNADLPTSKGGGKYVQKTIKAIVADQLQQAKNQTNSPVAFIQVGDITTMDNVIDIYSSFKSRLPFIAGLIDSWRAGSGRRTRILCEKGADNVYRWRVIENPGVERNNIRFEYGGLVQGFRTVPFGDFGTSMHSIGRTSTGAKTFYHKEPAEGIDQAAWGAWPQSVVYQDLADLNDLRRRTRQAVRRIGKVGKQLAIGIRVGALDIKDGWTITDDVPIAIKRGAVDTTRWGSDYWTIWGWSWSSYPDGHTDLDLSIAPREDAFPPGDDLIPPIPVTPTKPVGILTKAAAPLPPACAEIAAGMSVSMSADGACSTYAASYPVPASAGIALLATSFGVDWTGFGGEPVLESAGDWDQTFASPSGGYDHWAMVTGKRAEGSAETPNAHMSAAHWGCIPHRQLHTYLPTGSTLVQSAPWAGAGTGVIFPSAVTLGNLLVCYNGGTYSGSVGVPADWQGACVHFGSQSAYVGIFWRCATAGDGTNPFVQLGGGLHRVEEWALP